MTCPATIFSTLLTPSKSSPDATGVSSVAAATGGRRAEDHHEEKGQGGVRVEGDADPPGPQSSQHRASHFFPLTFIPLLASSPLLMIRARVRVIVSGLMRSFIPVVRVTVKVPSQFRVRHRLRAL